MFIFKIMMLISEKKYSLCETSRLNIQKMQMFVIITIALHSSINIDLVLRILLLCFELTAGITREDIELLTYFNHQNFFKIKSIVQ